ncbi:MULTISPECIES: anti-sigma factor antagonist [Mycobacterium]|uniref:Anti-sigma factor antagonist n=1 Tax=Mycobacterium kiyosense TaxID=2871094 RepID=A0A9P3QC97_9MYCO|nr:MULTISPECIES: anti-sigma factor antagonist [Mycobacterium]BDB43724.1 anti-sigma factor antagonist [Mycobacterium kiyosense]BDE15283.1 anti-sigma factor antagonist [Mycobacterium sp. 20KCMC460]GLB84513.1 anti-sigma factor antagonist [Mycobacterium kiyosense]GLB91874.1 anti-sigma factor antagonist [Mycobacterium kiyosense]GLB97947.1 anti-sigma factor antagonist [Mycobacterium kiyosense]
MNIGPSESFSIPLPFSSRLASELGGPTSTLRATTLRNGSAVVVQAGGEVDAANEHTWQGLLREAAAVAVAPGPLVVDVSGLDFMGCCAFTVLADEAERCRRRGITLRMVSDDPGLGRIVHACALSGVLPVHPTTEAALAAA